MDEVTHTILEQPNGGFGGLGSGFVGGIIGGALFGNGGFGWGGNRGGVGYDTGAINGMANQLNTISGQIANADRDLLMQTANSNQFVGNLVNSTGDAIVGSINSNARDIQAGIFQNTLTQTQSHEQINEFVKRNSSELIDQKATEQQLISFIKQKGMQIYMGNTSTQNIVDVCSALIAYKVLHNKS